MVACPFSVPKYEWSKVLPKVQKCTMCPDRVAAGQPTACAEICPTGATKFGERDDLIAGSAAAHSRQSRHVRQSHLRPERSRRHFGAAALKCALRGVRISCRPVEGRRCPVLTYRVLSRIPDFVPLGGMLLGGVWWITHRREEVAAAEGEHQVTRKRGSNEDEIHFLEAGVSGADGGVAFTPRSSALPRALGVPRT